MALVSLIVPTIPGSPSRSDDLGDVVEALGAAGHRVELLVIAEPDGLAASAVEGLHQAEGDVLIVLDPTMGYTAVDVARVVEPLIEGRADLIVASRALLGDDLTPPRRRHGLSGAALRRLTGTSDPLSGLIALSRTLRDEAGGSFRAVGSKFSFELLARLGGRWLDVPVRSAPSRLRRPEFDDLRHLKRLADHRFGNLSRLVQFCVVGGSGAIVDLTCYFALQPFFEQFEVLTRTHVPPTRIALSLALARGLAIAIALGWNFSLNRRLTFSYARSGSLGRQFVAYALSNALGIGLNYALSLGLPRKVAFFHDHKLAAAVVGIVAGTAFNFPMSRWVVFRGRDHRAATESVEPITDPALAKS